MRLALLVLLTATGGAAQTRPVVFEVVVPGVLAPLDTVYLAGTFNGWNPGDQPGNGAALPMTPTGPNRFRLTVDVAGDSVAYKYTLGSWPSVEMSAGDLERDNRLLGARAVARDTVAQWLIPSVALGAWRADDLLRFQAASVQAWAERNGATLGDSLSLPAVDALLASSEAAWAADARRLGVPATPLLPGVVQQMVSGPGAGRSEHVMRTVAVPRTRALLDAFEREPVHVSRLVLLNQMVWDVVRVPLLFEPDAGAADAAAGLAARIGVQAERYCGMDFGVRGGDLGCRVRDNARALGALWVPVAADAHGDLAAATDGFVALVDGGIDSAARDETAADSDLALFLVRRYGRRARGADGLRMLDVLTARTSDLYTTREDLRAAYVRIDPAGGGARFERLLDERPAIRLATVENAPVFTGLVMPDAAARAPFAFDRLAGRLVLLDIWATWCGPCIAEIPTFNALHAALAGRDDVAFVSVLDDARIGGQLPLEAEAFLAAQGVAYPALYDVADDSALGAVLRIRAYPSKFLVFPDGTMRRVPLLMDWRQALRLATDELGLPPVATN